MAKELQAIWSGKNRIITVHLPFIIFEDGGYQVLYCPPLDLTGYGTTEQEAKQSFEIVLDEYFKYTANKGTLLEDLTNLGWKIKKKNLRKPIVPPDLSYSLESNEDFKRIFNTHDFRKGNTKVAMPAMC